MHFQFPLLRFYVRKFVGSSLGRVSHISMYDTFSVASHFCRVALVILFPTKLDSFHSEFICKSYSVLGFSCFLYAVVVPWQTAVVRLPLEWHCLSLPGTR